MPRRSPFNITLSAEERRILTERTRKYTLPYFNVVRAKMILLAADGLGNDAIAARLDVGRDVVSQWRRRFFERRVPGLEEGQRSGRPRAFPPRGGRAR
jgi:transposase-like protein